NIDMKMPSEAPVLPTQTEKPQHYTYLKEFRTQQCPLFLQHKCTQHRPFTCFHWHFLNQRRRRPVRKRDGSFNYSPDVYCTKYDETSGQCPDGEECPLLHRTAGDTERRYHLRYYKTGTCVHETDTRGNCVKNGPHCAFAHGAHDLRPPVYDSRELAGLETEKVDMGMGMGLLSQSPCGPSSLEKEKILNEDPKWNDTNYVLTNYKTEQCKRPPRLCRQGYACPQYHNTRDRRRSPRKVKYRSTPCPNVKHGDDWGDPTQCENGENCPYCHTRTEQQFHPEIYKSTKCNDMVQTGYCPRGPFCAFAHVEQEMTSQRELPMENSLAAFFSALPGGTTNGEVSCNSNTNGNKDDSEQTTQDEHPPQLLAPAHNNNKPVDSSSNKQQPTSIFNHSSMPTSTVTNTASNLNSNNSMHHTIIPEPIGKGRSGSTSSSIASDSGSAYLKAPGSEREDPQIKLRQQLQAIEKDVTIDLAEKAKRKQNLLLLHNLNVTNSFSASSGTSGIGSSATSSSSMSPHAPVFYPAGDTVESVIANTLEELNIDEFDLSTIDKELENDNETNSVSSSLSAGFSSTGYIGSSSVPMAIPSSSQGGFGGFQAGSVGSLPESPSSLPSLPPAFVPQHIQQQQKQEQQLEQAQAAFLSHANPGKFSAAALPDIMNNHSPRSTPNSLSSTSSLHLHNNTNSEIMRLREELIANKAKLASWEEGIAQARSACEAWKKEAEEATRKVKMIEEEHIIAIKQKEEVTNQLRKCKIDVERMSGGPHLHVLHRRSDLEMLPLPQLKLVQQTLRMDLDAVDKVVYQHTAMKCLVCQEKNRSVAVMPCNHYVLCDSCVAKRTECPYCHAQIKQLSNIVLPL
ncbi:unnamed protein product, partial [Owenia fusiformis]